MSTTTDTLVDVMPKRRLFTALEYHQMGEAGILHEDEHIELIDGEILQMAAFGGKHIAGVLRLNNTLTPRLAGRAIVSVQNSRQLSDATEPEPDVVLLKPRADFYADGVPPASAVLLVIEVADTSLTYDRKDKIPRYAAAGIPEAWLMDVQADRVTSYRDPLNGTYQVVTEHGRGDTIAPLAFPDVPIALSDILP